MNWATLVTSASLVCVSAASVAPAAADPRLFKEAKDLGFPAQNCQYCHVSKIPKKDTFTARDLNERGQWLVAEKTKQNAPDVKADWLKNYPGGKEQK
jgi:hypothetical protein